MLSRHQWHVPLLILMSVIGAALGIWLIRAGFIVLGCIYIAVFLWRSKQFVGWMIAPARIPSDSTPSFASWKQHLVLSVICLLGAAVCAIGVYLWRWWPEEWQAGLVFILFGLLALVPVTIREVQLRRNS
jgi:hypothetical protein